MLNKTNFLIIFLVTSVSFFMLWHRLWFSPDQFFVFVAIIMLLTGRIKQYLKDWTLPIFLLLFYDFLRGILPHFSELPHVNPMIKFAMLKGFFWSVALQNLLTDENIVHWYDVAFVFLYMTHFVIPLTVALIFWLNRKEAFKEYTASLVIISYLALLTFILFPTMPPWMASLNGYIPPITKIYDLVVSNFASSVNIPTVYSLIRNNLVAAMPSLHAAYPFLTYLFLVRVYPKLKLPLLPYLLGVWFSLLYLGEHYSLDILVALLYSTFVFLAVTRRRAVLNYFSQFISLKELAKKFSF